MNEQVLQVWYADPDVLLDVEQWHTCLSFLTEAEKIKMDAFRFEPHRREYLATRALVRSALSHLESNAPGDWRFVSNEYGKPAVLPDSGIRFNVSNCPRLVVCAATVNAEVGVDAEPHVRSSQILEVATSVFSDAELEQFQGLDASSQDERAISLWTLKESYIKARGAGLSLPLREFSFLFGEKGVIELRIDPRLGDKAIRWQFCLFDHEGHRIALMVELKGFPELHVWEVQDFRTKSMRPVADAVRWFPERAESS